MSNNVLFYLRFNYKRLLKTKLEDGYCEYQKKRVVDKYSWNMLG